MDEDSATTPVQGSIAARFTKKPTPHTFGRDRKRGICSLECTGGGRRIEEFAEFYERAYRICLGPNTVPA
jgi:hypothetical protein